MRPNQSGLDRPEVQETLAGQLIPQAKLKDRAEAQPIVQHQARTADGGRQRGGGDNRRQPPQPDSPSGPAQDQPGREQDRQASGQIARPDAATW